jgi:hypothetical protein
MSEEKFKRSETGHSASDLHKHGGLDAHENKTERENLEEAIEALNDSEETENLVDIEKDMKGEVIEEDIEEIAEKKESEKEPEAEPSDEVKAALEEIENEDTAKEPVRAAEPENSWKTKAENQAYMTIDTVEEPGKKKKGGAGWKFATVFFLLLAVAGCGVAAYLFFNDGKTSLLNRVITSQTKEEYDKSKTQKPTQSVEDPKFDFEANAINYSGATKLLNPNASLSPIKLEYTKDGKYTYIIGDVAEGVGGFAIVLYKENKKDGEWKILQGGHTFTTCDQYTDEQKKFMKDYKYIDDDLSSKYIGCYEGETSFPE